MKIQFDKKNADQVALIKAMGSKEKSVSLAAQEAFANLIGPLISPIYMAAGTSSLLTKPFNFSENEGPSIPVNPLSDLAEGNLSFWSQTKAGGLPTNHLTATIEELRFQSFRLDTAVDWDKKWARRQRLDVVAMYLEALYNQHLIKSEDNAWSVILAALAGAQNPNTTGKGNVFHTQTAGVFTLDDLVKMFVVFRRQAAAYNNGTPVGNSSRPTDMIISPEIEARIRSFAYQPINTQAANGVTITANSQQSSAAVVGLPDSERAAIFNGAGAPSFFGIALNVINELGINQRYEKLFSVFMGSTNTNNIDLTSAVQTTFNAAADDLIIAFDNTKDFAWKGYATDNDDGLTPELALQVDDQHLIRSNKVGWFGASTEAVLVTETRSNIAMKV